MPPTPPELPSSPSSGPFRVECPACRALVDAAATLAATAAGALAFTCPACAATATLVVGPPVVAGVSAPPAPDPDAPPACPKCGATRREHDACVRCGLAVAHMAAYAARRDDEVPAEVIAAWAAAEARWDDPASHERLRGLVAQHAAFAWAAARYREAQRQRPGDAVAAAQLERLTRAAEVTLRATSTAAQAEPPSRLRLPLIALIILIATTAAGYAILRATPSPAETSPPPP
jgi:hypothetical protein